MTRTFLLTVAYSDDIIDPVGEAQDIEEACVNAGIDVESVRLWASPTLSVTPPTAMQPLPQNPQAL